MLVCACKPRQKLPVTCGGVRAYSSVTSLCALSRYSVKQKRNIPNHGDSVWCRFKPISRASVISMAAVCFVFAHRHIHCRRNRFAFPICDICALERKRRCRVMGSCDLSPTLDEHPRFLGAPYIHAFNEPKYHASQMRALHFAREKKTVTIWYFAQDRPRSNKVTLLRDDDLNERRQQWITYHDMKTGGVMGLQPLVKDMPLRITKTDHARKDKGLFKNSRCKLHGFKLHPVDEARYAECCSDEFVCQYMPESLGGVSILATSSAL